MRSRLLALGLFGTLCAATFLFLEPVELSAQKQKDKKGPSLKAAEELMRPGPRPKKPALPPSTLPLELVKGERIAFVGNGTAERFNLYGHFETLLHVRFPDKELVIRNFARPADEVANRQRSGDYTKLDDPLYAFNPDTIICFFGFCESFAGPDSAAKFEEDYVKFIDEYTRKYPRDDAGSPPRFVLVVPFPIESNEGDPYLPQGNAQERNKTLSLYAQKVRDVGRNLKIAVVDTHATVNDTFNDKPGLQYTINGVHQNEAGDKVISTTLDKALFGSDNPGAGNTEKFEKIRAAVNDKSWVHAQDYRMINGWYVYGGRRTYDTETFPREYVKIRNMAAVRDRYIWDMLQGKPVPDKPDDSNTGDLIVPPTRFGQVQKSEMPVEIGPRILPPDEFIKTCTVPPGFEIKLFADEKRFPELAKPVQMSFDNKGRLWVSTMPSYPQWRPGDPRPKDKLIILEDTDGDGMADKCTTFYDDLHCPTGFEFFDGGVLVVNQPRILFLKDTNGDDKADVVVHVSDGWATDDTHHTVGAWEMNHAGMLHMLEGVSMSTATETPWGPFRNYGSSGGYVVDPRNWKVRHFNTPGYGNPWCYVFNEWGQGFCGDGTGAAQHWDTPLSGAQYQGRKGLTPLFNTEGMRPVVGSEFLITRQFPDDVQGQFIYSCVINMNGMPRWKIEDDGGGYKGTRVRMNPNDPKTAYDLIKSTEKHFRPVDAQIGPDGALWFGDWANPLIGHMQYSQRDPNRDHVHGRVYRLVYKDKPLLKPVTQFGKSLPELLGQLNEYEWRTRYRARTEIRSRPAGEVLAAIKEWVGKLDPNSKSYDRLRTEALWLQHSFHQVDVALLESVLKCNTPDARAAAVRIATEERDAIPQAFQYLQTAATDSHPRVRTEACRGLSYFPNVESAKAVIAAMSVKPSDYWVNYTADAALAANIKAWGGAYAKGDLTQDEGVKKTLEGIISTDKRGSQLVPYLQILLGKEPRSQEEKNKAMAAITTIKGGSVENGRKVFRNNCVACHKAMGEGEAYGPEMDKDETGKNRGGVGKRLTPIKILESIIDPNAEVDDKYRSTQIDLADGRKVIGLLVKESKEATEIFDPVSRKIVRVKAEDIDKKTVLKQSSMPEGLAATIAPSELLDLLAFLNSLK